MVCFCLIVDYSTVADNGQSTSKHHSKIGAKIERCQTSQCQGAGKRQIREAGRKIREPDRLFEGKVPPIHVSRFVASSLFQIHFSTLIFQKVKLIHLGNLVLTSTKEPGNFFSNVTASAEEVCTAHIHSNKVVKERMDEIKVKYNLDDSTEWRKVVLEVGKRKKAEAFNSNRDKGKPGQNKPGQRKGNKKGAGNAIEKNGAADSTPQKSKQKQKSDTTPKSNNKNDNENRNKKSPKQKDSSKKEKPKPNAKAEPELPSDSVAPKVTTEDSFFITQNGSSYQSTAVVDRVQADGPDDGLDRKERRAKQFGKTPRPPKVKKFNKFATAEKHDGSKDSTGGDDHPSWAAKRKQKAIPNFQGKKMKFGEDGGAEKAQPSTKPVDTNIHPSWAAKQKLKPVLTEFKGTKTTFD